MLWCRLEWGRVSQLLQTRIYSQAIDIQYHSDKDTTTLSFAESFDTFSCLLALRQQVVVIETVFSWAQWRVLLQALKFRPVGSDACPHYRRLLEVDSFRRWLVSCFRFLLSLSHIYTEKVTGAFSVKVKNLSKTIEKLNLVFCCTSATRRTPATQGDYWVECLATGSPGRSTRVLSLKSTLWPEVCWVKFCRPPAYYSTATFWL